MMELMDLDKSPLAIGEAFRKGRAKKSFGDPSGRLLGGEL